jgi:tRNA (cytidine/uridine-2'-O-)-methyltransferase
MNPLLNIVLHRPEIPNNTGSIGRTAAATGCRLHVIHPIGFSMDEKARRRAGLDYWDAVDCVEHEDLAAYRRDAAPGRLWLYTARATRPHWDAEFLPGDHLMFGRESDGAPPEVHDWVTETWGADHRIALPMLPDPRMRSLNQSNAVTAAVYEAIRQIRPAWAESPGD